MNPNFYRAFEDAYRGSRALILDRLRAYEPFLQPLLQVGGTSRRVLDLGCGRGEWLEWVGSIGFDGRGVDLDEDMLREARERGLVVDQGDAIEALRSAKPESFCVVSAFHVVEHLSFPLLCELLKEAHRVLEPGGLLILETPNPDNIRVASKNFYLDPSHQKPIPAELLGFVVKYVGFMRIKELFLQEQEGLRDPDRVLEILDVFESVSQDYAIVGQKAGRQQSLEHFEPAFQANYGMTFHELACRFQEQWRDGVARLALKEAQLARRVEALEVITGLKLLRMARKLMVNVWRRLKAWSA